MTLFLVVLSFEGVKTREKVSIAGGLKESVWGRTFLIACNIRDGVSKFFDKNVAAGEGGDYIRLEKLGRIDRSPVVCGKFFCDDSEEYVGVG